ncbi:MAG TPA: polyamine ABC transporter substrate-binding protein [Steroidobacteraceae bacterium]|jgi:putrescine transport system substrate-binding protein|nr:polyamine ABC transporter substrate-binding protein [Steroidobacteraceae bacterium]
MSAAHRLLPIGASVAVLAIAGCSTGSGTPPGADPPPAAAGPSGTDSERVLNVYNWAEYIDPAVVRDFEKEFGIKVNYDVYDSNELLETKLLIGHTNYDVVVPSGYFVENQIKAGIYQKLDKTALPNLKNLDPEVIRAVALYDPGNQYAVDYMWLSTTGIAYDVAKIRARMADAPVDSWRLMFDPRVLARFQDCGVAMLDAPINVVGAALIFLGKDPNSESAADLKAAERQLISVRQYVRYMDSNRIAADLANGDICLALDWSGDIPLAREAASIAGGGVMLDFSVPREGSVSNLDVLAIPADAPHPRNAHLFINYLLRPEVAARNSTVIKYANGVAGSVTLLSAELRDDPVVYPPAEVRARLVPSRAKSHEYTRMLMRTWTRFKAYQ